MPTNARIERLLREVEGQPKQPVVISKGAMKGFTKVAIGLVAIGAVAGAIAASQDREAESHSYVGVPPAVSPAAEHGNVQDLTY